MDLQLFWFGILGTLLAGYAVLDGFDFGVGSLHFVARTDEERRVLLNAIGPVWDGNEVWLVTFGGALFAAFPEAYASAFSAMYLPFMLLLSGLVFRAVAIEFRSKRPSRAWRLSWDVAFFAASVTNAFLMGATVANLLRGIAIDVRGDFTGTLGDLLSPYALLVGAFTVALFSLHGAVFLLGKTEGALHARLKRAVWTGTGVTFVLYLFTTIVTLVTLPAATANFGAMPWAWGVVGLNVLAAGNVPRAVYLGRLREAFVSSALTIVCLVVLFGVALFPNLVVSTLDPAFTLTIRNASSSAQTLATMRTIALVGMPFVIGYTGLVYWVFRGKVKVGSHSY